MGNREALIEGAKTCLLEKGYSRTTARDIATAAGVSLAAIGYHFGSKEALLNEAMREALIGEWAAEVGGAMAAREAGGGSRERFVATWRQVVESLSNPRLRALWTTQFEVLSLGASNPELVAELSKMQGEAREGLAQMFGTVDADGDPETAQAVGSFLQALMLGVVALHLFDADSAPTGQELARSIRLVADRLDG
ncbi:TetR/AcrR family transcriptional regulator [Kribbella capetownensis]|uniref:TetR/AcrR family transcriptional regulator n=1 Tax=Kribbella capetownensis TaxID=1572659 RepID=A0A4R0JZU5_9ACTN|nr:TetR family transcriptional regulator [Kribbella capetownensis]TCC53133.1 TetR/AcrR family transcriptional regulator [Kribbella capetownensis]